MRTDARTSALRLLIRPGASGLVRGTVILDSSTPSVYFPLPSFASFGSFFPFPGETTMIDAPHGTVEVESPAEVLRDENGVFEVTSPYGYVFQATCRRGANLITLCWRCHQKIHRS
jgi:hypothetical protein